ncbi:Bud site selection protein bud4 [Malassezia caprae]|uniref:Bud site selection protein bud4 n=1 Tax=Malassezia caprae TaxID=1381934 RepID=A0AAF0EAA1_9BASI|nr:Bud site selection protein bud4 [Malassezia caprae]
MSAPPPYAQELGAERIPRAQPSLDESFSSGLGLGIVVNKDGPKVTGADLGARRVIDRPVSEMLAGGNPFQRSEPAQRASAMPSSATVDRLAINDVLEQYKPGDNSMLDTSFPAVPPMSFLGPPTLNLGSLRMHDEPSLSAFLAHDQAARSEPRSAPEPAETPATPAPPSPVRPPPVPKIVSNTQASPVRHSSPKRAIPAEIGDLADPEALPSPERLRQARDVSPDRLQEPPVGQVDEPLDVDALLDEPGADESGSVNVDDLLQEDALDADGPGMARSTTMRRIHVDKEQAAPAPDVDLPTLPSWSPIVWDSLLPDVEPAQRPRAVELPARTVRPRISRDAIRARVERKKSHVLSEIPPERRQPASVRPPPRGPVAPTDASGPSSRPDPPLLHSPLAQVQTALQDQARRTSSEGRAPPLAEELERQSQWFGAEAPQSASDAAAPPADEPHEDSDHDEFVSPLSRVSALPENESAPPTEAPSDEPSTAFRHLMERELTRIVRESDKRYKVRERDVYVGKRPMDRGLASAQAPWKRVQQPNEVTALAQGTRAATPRLDTHGTTTHGRLFLSLDTFMPVGLSVPPNASFYCVLDNGIHRVKTPSTPLVAGGPSPMYQEFELVENARFALTLSLLLDADGDDVLDDDVAETGALPADARTGMGRFLSRHLGSKAVRAKPPAPTRIGTLGVARLVLADILANCFARCATLDLPVCDLDQRTLRRSASPKARGALRVRVFYLPPLPDAVDQVPGNMEEAVQGMSSVAWRDTATSYEGILTQLGGDCGSWRRRPMRIVGLNLVCYNEVTKRPVTRIDLVQALSVDERPPAAEGRDTDEVQVPRSFCLTFRDGERIYLYADSDDEKIEWMNTLHNIITHKLTPTPAWAIAAASASKARFPSQRPSTSLSSAAPTQRPMSPPPEPAPQPKGAVPEAPPPATLSSRVTPALPTKGPAGGARPRPAKPPPQAPRPPSQTPQPPSQTPAPRASVQMAGPVDVPPDVAHPPVHGAKRAAQRVRHMASRWLGKRT